MADPNGSVSEDEFILICQTAATNQEGAARAGVSLDRFRRRRADIEARKRINLRGGLSNRISATGANPSDVPYVWLKDEGISAFVKNPEFITRDEHAQALADAVAAVRKLAPTFPSVKYAKVKDGHCLVLNFTDLHFGAYGLDKARQVVLDAMGDALTRSSGYPIEQIIFVIGSDCLQTDTAHYTTTKGTPVSGDGSTWSQAFKAAQEAYTQCLATLLPIAPVHVVHVSGNHDELMSYALAQVIEATFAKAKNITFDVTDTPRKYHQYHSSLLAFTHGDKLKDTDIPMIVSHEAPEAWGKTRHRYVYMGHIHHNRQIKYQAIKEHPGITLQWLRSPKPTDAWHRDHGFLGGQGITSFIHSRDGGQVASLSVNL